MGNRKNMKPIEGFLGLNIEAIKINSAEFTWQAVISSRLNKFHDYRSKLASGRADTVPVLLLG